MIHVWALPSILSFSPDTSRMPLHTFSVHRGPISAIACGHSLTSANIAVSVSGDKSAIVWDYHNGQALRTYLLPENPTAIALDPADRAFYVAYADGSLQTVDFYDDIQKTTATDVLRDIASSHRPIQPPARTRFDAASQKLGEALSLSLSWDGTTLISGHMSGKVAAWDIAKSNYLSTLANLPGPVSSLQFLQPMGFLSTSLETFKIHSVIKPKQDAGAAASGSGLVPPNFTLHMQFTGRLRSTRISAAEINTAPKSSFGEALMHASFPTSMLEESLADLETWQAPSKANTVPSGDFMSLDEGPGVASLSSDSQQSEIKELKKQLASLQRIQKVTFSQLSELREEKEYLVNQERKRAERAKLQASRGHTSTNGTSINHTQNDVHMNDVASESE